MDAAQAIERARSKAEAQGIIWLVIKRTDHPMVAGDYFYAIADDDKHAWTVGEEVIYVATGAPHVRAVS